MRISDWSSDVCSSDLDLTMRPFDRLAGIAAPLLKANIDTDMIIRVEHMTASDQSRLGDHAFETWRIGPDGREDPGFVLNQPRYRSAPILLAGDNFGCGSSREHAVGALLGRGIRIVIRSEERRVGKECVRKCRLRWVQ